MSSMKAVVALCACLGVSPAVWGNTGLIVQTVIPYPSLGEAEVSGNTIAASVSTDFVGSAGTEIYTKEASGDWQLTQSLSVPGPESLSGNELILGDRSGALFQANPTIIYTASAGGTWTEQASLTATDVTTCDWFGAAVAIDGNVAVVGARNHGGGAPDPWCSPGHGAAYVFERDASGNWIQTAELLPPATKPLFDFGQIVAVSGNTILVSATNIQTTVVSKTLSTVSVTGETFVYTQQSPGNWSQTAEIPGPGTLGTFAIDGNEVVVKSNAAPADVYTLDAAGQPALSQLLYGATVAETGAPGQIFGTGIGLSSSLLLIAADTNVTMCPMVAGPNIPPCQSIATPGGVYAYQSNAGRWQPLSIYAPTNLDLMALGDSVSTDGATAIASTAKGIAVMQMGDVPAGYVVVPSYQPPPPAPPSSNPPDPPTPRASMQPSSSSGGGASGLFALALLTPLFGWRIRRRARRR